MNTIFEFNCDLDQLENVSKKLSKITNIGDIFFLKGELGVGKTTFSRFLINFLHERFLIDKPKNIKSPSFPIMINYPLVNFEICHYDLYRLKNKNELTEIFFFEYFKKNISIIEWPDIILDNFLVKNYYLIEFNFVDEVKRFVKINHTEKKIFDA